MSKKSKILIILLPILIVAAILVWYLSGQNIAVLQTAGIISQKERSLMFIALILSAIVVLPVFALTILIAWRYREGNTKAKYSPDWDHSRVLETIWWGIPLVIITILSVITWNSSHALDPYQQIASKVKPLQIQVVSLNWKWLFIYPDQHVASVNKFVIPLDTPINFSITSDTVMNSFWLPNLGGQIYAMPGMSTQLHLMASKAGSYPGSSANISGKGFAGMTFAADAVNNSSYNEWISALSKSNLSLNLNSYNKLAAPSTYNPISYYKNVPGGLFESIVMKYMEPITSGNRI